MGNTPDGYRLIPSTPDKPMINIQSTEALTPTEDTNELTPTEATPNTKCASKQYPTGYPIGSMLDVLRLLQHSKTDKELNTLETLAEHYDELLTTKWFQVSELINWYSANLGLISKGDRKSEILAKILPVNDRRFIWTLYQNRTPIQILKIIAPKISLDQLNDHEETFLFQKSTDELDLRINYITDLIEQIPNVPIHHISSNHCTFLRYILINENMWKFVSKNTWKRFFKVLSDHNFKFIESVATDQLLISFLVENRSEHIFEYSILITPKSCDLTEDCQWLISLFTRHSDYNQHNYVCELLRRDDYESFLCKSYRNLRNVFGIEYFKFIIMCYRLNKSKTLAMLQYADELGNTVIHYMAARHDKTLLHPIMNTFGTQLTLGPNVKGRTPKQLYGSSKLSALLS
jgi:hypothetical protein